MECANAHRVRRTLDRLRSTPPPRRVPAPAAPSAGATTVTGSCTVNVAPWPSALRTVTSPPINWQKRQTRARPRPVPPYLREIEVSPCANGRNSRRCCSSARPIPSSWTANSMKSRPLTVRRATCTVTWPLVVNFAALLSRLKRICRVLVRSACIVPQVGAVGHAQPVVVVAHHRADRVDQLVDHGADVEAFRGAGPSCRLRSSTGRECR